MTKKEDQDCHPVIHVDAFDAFVTFEMQWFFSRASFDLKKVQKSAREFSHVLEFDL